MAQEKFCVPDCAHAVVTYAMQQNDGIAIRLGRPETPRAKMRAIGNGNFGIFEGRAKSGGELWPCSFGKRAARWVQGHFSQEYPG